MGIFNTAEMSKPIVIEKTRKTPYVCFDSDNGRLEIIGSLLPTNSIGFFDSIFSLSDEYIQNPKEKTVIKVQLEYFNTSSSKLLLQLFIKFEDLVTKGKEVYLEWHYEEEDIDMHDAGKTYEASIKLPTILVPIEE